MKIYSKIIFILILLEIFLTSYLYYSSPSDSAICLDESSCEFVQNSSYGYVYGIKVSLFGLIAFIILLSIYLLSIKNKKMFYLYLLMCLLGSIIAIYFIYLQLFVLKQICSNCMIIDGTMILIFIISLMDYRKSKPILKV